jgi:hypothetical protein
VPKLSYTVPFLPETFLASLNMNLHVCHKLQKNKPNPDNTKLLSTVEQTVIQEGQGRAGKTEKNSKKTTLFRRPWIWLQPPAPLVS